LSYLSKQICDWSALADLDRRIVEAVRGGVAGVTPFTTVIGPSTPADQLRAARSHLRSMKIEALPPIHRGQRHRHERIRVGYLSADFHDHATSYLMAGLFERHDRAKFEISAYSFGPDQKDQSRARLMKAFDRFFDIRPLRDVDAARLLAAHEIDIAVDLKGYTGGARPAILAHRPAPIQVSYLGYPGTMGADFIDYVVADPITVPIDEQAFFTEKIVHLPDCYQANDRERPIAERTPSRAECGLPERGFVFASFNSGLKLTPAFFDIWMRLLKTVPNSVLWLLRDNPWVEANLRREATARGVSPERLVFAPRETLADHLARNRLADLFLDTLPYNAHTTASDALWAGLPVVSCIGTTFAGRVAASLLSAVGLPELITRSLEEYEALARHLASDPARLAGIRAKLVRNRLTTPLFDTDRFRRHLEAAYLEMWRIQQRGEKPRAFAVGSGDG
jgi:protein O-GlcNAc transferase